MMTLTDTPTNYNFDPYPRPIVSLFADDEWEAASAPDALGDLWQPQPIQQAQAQHNPSHRLDAVIESIEDGTYTFQAPADSHIAKVLQVWLIIQEAIEYLEPRSYPITVSKLKSEFSLAMTPKTLSKKITQVIALLGDAQASISWLLSPNPAIEVDKQSLLDESNFIGGIIEKLKRVL